MLAPTTRSTAPSDESDTERRRRRALLGAQTRALCQAGIQEMRLHFELANLQARPTMRMAAAAIANASASARMMERHENTRELEDEDEDDDDENPLVHVDAGAGGGSRLPGRGGLSAMGDDSRDASELREVLHEVRGECEAKSAELDARQGDLQLVRRALHAANSELSTYRQRTATMRALLGQAVREQCKAQIKHSQAIATAPPPPPLVEVVQIGSSPSTSFEKPEEGKPIDDEDYPELSDPNEEDDEESSSSVNGGSSSSSVQILQRDAGSSSSVGGIGGVGGGGGGGGGLPLAPVPLLVGGSLGSFDDDVDEDDAEEDEEGWTRGDEALVQSATTNLFTQTLRPDRTGGSGVFRVGLDPSGLSDPTSSAVDATGGGGGGDDAEADDDPLANVPTLVDAPASSSQPTLLEMPSVGPSAALHPPPGETQGNPLISFGDFADFEEAYNAAVAAPATTATPPSDGGAAAGSEAIEASAPAPAPAATDSLIDF